MTGPFPNPPPYLRGKIRSIDHNAQALRGNPWGDPTHRDLWVYTPPGYGTDNTKYPVIMVLPGFAGTGEGMLSRSLTDISLAHRIDYLIAGNNEHGKEIEPCPPFIAVLPDVMSSLGGTQFLDSPGIGNYASWLMNEVRPFIDGRLQTNGRWGATGRSSGGFGALSLAMRHPDAFSAVACHAGDMGFDLCYLADLPKALGPIRVAGGPMNFVAEFWKKRRFSSGEFAAMNVLCMAAAYDPADHCAPGTFPGTLPFDIDTGAIDFEAYHRWSRHDPLRCIDDPSAQAALKALDLLFIDAGAFDEYHLQLGARRFVQKLKTHNIHHIHEEFNGGHRGTSWRYDISLPMMARALTNPPGPKVCA